jgi:hypothetical protein
MDTPPQSGSGMRQRLGQWVGSKRMDGRQASQTRRDPVAMAEVGPVASESPGPEPQDVVGAAGRRPDAHGPDTPGDVGSARPSEPLGIVGSRIRYVFDSLFRPGLRRRNRAALDALWRLRRTKKVYAFLNSKGASGKTVGSTTTGLLFADAIKRDCVVVDMNDSPGGTARRLGIKRTETLQLQEYLRRYRGGEFETAESIAGELAWPRESGIFVISSEAVAKGEVRKYQAKIGLEKLNEGFHSVFCDLGNGIKSSGNLAAVEIADTLVFMGNVNSADSVVDFRRDDPTDEGDDLKNTMDAYESLGMPEKVRRGIIVILGARLGMRKRYADHYGFPLDRVFIVPNNRYMKRGNVVRKDRLPLSVRVVMYEILVAMMTADRPPDTEIKLATPADREKFESGDSTQDGDTETIPVVSDPSRTA